MLLPLISIALVGHLTRHAVPAVVDNHISSIETIVDRLGPSLGHKVIIDRDLRDHAIYFRGETAPPLNALKAIAAAAHATLQLDSRGYSIVRTPQDVQAISAVRASIRAAWIQDKLEQVSSFRVRELQGSSISSAFSSLVQKAVDNRNGIAHGDVDRSDGYFATMLLPPEQLLEELIKKIGISKLAELPSGCTTVFEDHPLGTAQQLPAHQDLIDHYAIMYRADGNADTVFSQPKDVISFARAGIQRDMIRYPDAAEIQSDRLRLKCLTADHELIFTLEGFDERGSKNVRAALLVGPTLGLKSSELLLRAADASVDKDNAALSSESLEALKYVSSPKGVTVSQDPVPMWIKEPIAHEPLDLWVRDALEALYPRQQFYSVAIDVADDFWQFVRSCVMEDGKMSLTALREVLREWLPYESVSEFGFMIARPIDPEYEEAKRANRTDLRNFFKSHNPISTLPARELATYIHGVSKAESHLPFQWVTFADPQGNVAPSELALSWPCLNFLGAIPDGGWNELVSGNALTAGALGVTRELEAFLESGQDNDVQSSVSVPDLLQYPEELYDADDLGATPVSVKALSELMLTLSRGQTDKGEGWGTIDQFSRRFSISPRYVQLNGAEPKLTLTREQFEASFANSAVLEGTRSGLELNLRFPHGCWMTRQVFDSFVPEAAAVPYGSLAASVRDSIWVMCSSRAFQRARQMRNGSQGLPGPLQPQTAPPLTR